MSVKRETDIILFSRDIDCHGRGISRPILDKWRLGVEWSKNQLRAFVVVGKCPTSENKERGSAEGILKNFSF